MFFFFKQKTAYEIEYGLVGSEMCIRDRSMGAAVELFEGSRALAVDRSRFRPVKTTNELLLIRSDLYRLTPECEVESTITHPEPFIDLGPAYRHVEGFEQRFPRGVPSIRDCTSLRVAADATFGADVVCTLSLIHISEPTRPY